MTLARAYARGLLLPLCITACSTASRDLPSAGGDAEPRWGVLGGTGTCTTSCPDICEGNVLKRQRCYSGTCVPETIVKCPFNLGCTPGPPAACVPACSDDSQCESGYYCDDKVCWHKLSNGTPCQADGACQSGHCYESVCCDQICDPCFSCLSIYQASPQKQGDCRPVRAGEDPNDSCEPEPGCGLSGACSGMGGCAFAPTSQACGNVVCQDGIVAGALCDGDGGCISNVSASCDPPRQCGANNDCTDACGADPDCPADYFCIDGHCAKKPIGQSCAADDECVEPYCRQGRCCAGDCLCDESGKCPIVCTDNSNCERPKLCDVESGRCLEPRLVDAEELDGCSVPARPVRAHWAWLLAIAVVLLGRRTF